MLLANKYAFLFPGQGSQHVGMLGNLPERFPIVKTLFHQASTHLGYDLLTLCQKGPVAELNQTEKTQPALLTASYALWRIYQEQGLPLPAYMAGHSLGEYTALVCAGALSFQEAVGLVAKRGQFMQQAVTADQGAMAAIIGLSDEEVAKLCHQATEQAVVSPANYNSPGQVVISGDTVAVLRAMELAKASGARLVTRIPVSVPSHCSLMRAAAEHLAEYLESVTIQTPSIPIINNVEAALMTDPETIKLALIHQLYQPVHWVDIIRYLVREGVNTFIECGPGKILTGLNKRIAKETTCQPFMITLEQGDKHVNE